MHSNSNRKRTPSKSNQTLNNNTYSKYQNQSRLIQNKIFISSHHITPLSNSISNKLQQIKQQISRQLNQRLPHQKYSHHHSNCNHNYSNKTSTILIDKQKQKNIHLNQNQHYSTSIKKTKSAQKIRSGSVTPLVTKLNFDSVDYREKYYQANEQFLNQKKKHIYFQQKVNQFKHLVCLFLEDPNAQLGSKLQKYIYNSGQQNLQQNQDLIQNNCQKSKLIQSEAKIINSKLWKNIEKICNLSQQIQTYQSSLIQIMNIFQVQDLQTLMNQIQEKVNNINKNNIDELTFKIMELQASINKIAIQYQKKIQQIKYNYQNQLKVSNGQIAFLNQKLNDMDKNIQGQKIIYQNLRLDLRQICEKWKNKQKQKNIVWITQVIQLRDIHQILLNHQSQAHNMKQQFQQNRNIITRNNQEVQRLQHILQQIAQQEKQQKLQDQKVIQQKQTLIQSLQTQNQNLLKKHTENLKLLQAQIKEKQKQKNAKQETINQLQSYMRVIAKKLQLDESSNYQSIASKIVDIKQKLISAQKFLSWHEKQLNTKQNILKQFNYNIQNLITQNKQIKNNCKSISSQRDQYKYLLGNLRDQVIELKKQHKQEIEKIIKQKDEQIVHSNMDILQDNASLNDKNTVLKNQIKILKQNIETNQKQIGFCNKKIQILEKKSRQKEQLSNKSQQQLKKYKQHVIDIQKYFKQVQNIRQSNSKRIIELQKQNNLINSQLKILSSQRQSLQKQCQQKRNSINSFSQEVSRLSMLIKDQRQLQKCNSQLRLSNLSKDGQIRKLEEQIKYLKYQNKQKTGQINTLLKKLNNLMDKSIQNQNTNNKKNHKKQTLNKQLNKVGKNLQVIRAQWAQIKNYLQQQINKIKFQYSQEINNMIRMMNNIINDKQIDCEYKIHEKDIKISDLQAKIVQLSEKVENYQFEKYYGNDKDQMLIQDQYQLKQQKKRHNKEINESQISKQNNKLQNITNLISFSINNQKAKDIKKKQEFQINNQKIQKQVQTQIEVQKQQIGVQFQLQSQSYNQRDNNKIIQQQQQWKPYTQQSQKNQQFIQIANNKLKQNILQLHSQIQSLRQKNQHYQNRLKQYQKSIILHQNIIKQHNKKLQKQLSKRSLLKAKIKNLQNQIILLNSSYQHFKVQIKNNLQKYLHNYIISLMSQINDHLNIKDQILQKLQKNYKQKNEKNKQNLLSILKQVQQFKNQLSQIKILQIQKKKEVTIFLDQIKYELKSFYYQIIQKINIQSKEKDQKYIQKKQTPRKNNDNNIQLPKKSDRKTYQSPEKIYSQTIHQQQHQSDTPTPNIKKMQNDSYQENQQKYQQIQKQQQNQKSRVIIQSLQINDNAVITEENSKKQQVQRVKQILNKLKQNQQPDVPYFEQIRKTYQSVIQKRKPRNLTLDLSQIEGKHSISSPSQMSLYKEFNLQKRTYTDPCQQFKDSNRSEKLRQSFKLTEFQLHWQNQYNKVKKQYDILDEQNLKLIQKYDTLLNEKQQVQKQYTQLQNKMSSNAIKAFFIKFINSIFDERLDEFENTLNILCKLIGISSKQIQQFKNQIEKRKKKKGGFFSSLFK